MVIKESSLEIGQDVGEDNYIYEEIEEAGNQSSTTYASFKKRDKNTIWGLEETKLFYQVLSAALDIFQCMTLDVTLGHKTMWLEFFIDASFFPWTN